MKFSVTLNFFNHSQELVRLNHAFKYERPSFIPTALGNKMSFFERMLCFVAYLAYRASGSRMLGYSVWNQLSLSLDPALPNAASTVTVTLEVTTLIPQSSNVFFKLPGFLLDSDLETTKVEFTVSFVQGSLVNLFEYYAEWSPQKSELAFKLAEDLVPGMVVAIIMASDVFTLPTASEKDSVSYTALVTNGDISVIIAPTTPFLQSDPIYPVIQFIDSSLFPVSTGLSFSFSLNRGVFAGDKLILRIPGYVASGPTVPVTWGETGNLFVDDSGEFDSANFKLTLVFSFPLSDPVTFVIGNLALPSGQSQNDESLQVRILPWSFEAIKSSPALGVVKQFNISSLSYDPVVPLAGSAITITLQPSVDLYAGTTVTVHLRGGFTRTVQSGLVNVYGISSSIFGYIGSWNGTAVSLTVQPDTLVRCDQLTEVWIPISEGFVLPSLLTENDGSLLVEASSLVVIAPEPIKTSPKVGPDDKRFYGSSIAFNPVAVEFACNTDLLSGTIVNVHLGGLTNILTSVTLEGSGGTRFIEPAIWDPDSQSLNLSVATPITAGSVVTISIPGFVLPNSLLENDESLYLASATNGIPDPQYFPSSPPIGPVKGFPLSELWYGQSSSVIPYPGKTGNVSIKIEPNFALLPGAELVVYLPGFSTTVATSVLVESDDVFVGSSGRWNGSALTLTIAPGRQINALESITITIGEDQLVIPESKEPNDPSLQLEVKGNQWLPIEPIKSSVPVIPRRFTLSSLSMNPETPVTATDLSFGLEASVDIQPGELIQITLPGFSRTNNGPITLIRDSLNQLNCTANWSLNVLEIECQERWYANTFVNLDIPSEFVSPRSLGLNSPLVTIAIPGSISTAPFATCPLVGDGPYVDQQFCMHQYDRGVRVHVSNAVLYPELIECLEASECSATDWITDACSVSQLTRCGCGQLTTGLSLSWVPNGLTVTGFNLQLNDTLIVSQNSDCLLNSVGIQQIGSPTVAENADGGLTFPLVRALITGQFNVCLLHAGKIFPVGTLTVRAACESPNVGYNGGCFADCPYGFIPQFGECLPLTSRSFNEPLGFQIALLYPGASVSGLGNLAPSDPMREYFDYQFTLNLKLVLNELEDRISVYGIKQTSEPDSIIVSSVFTPGQQRTSYELYALLSALFMDEYSGLYSNEFFATTNRTFPVRNLTSVQWCPSVERYYLGGCPTLREWGSPAALPTWYSLAVALGGCLTGVVIGAVALALYRLDSGDLRVSSVFRPKLKFSDGHSPNDFSVVKITGTASHQELTLEVVDDVSKLDPGARVEFARTWLDGQLLDEPLIMRRKKRNN